MKWLLNNWEAKSVSFGLAVVAWLYIFSFQVVVAEFELPIPVEFANLSPTMALENPVDDVYIKVAASRSVWLGLSIDDFSATADLKSVALGENPITIELVSRVPKAQIISQREIEALVSVGRSATKEVEIESRLIGFAKEGFVVKDVQVVPDKAIIRGSQKLINITDFVQIDIDVSGRSQDFRTSAKPYAVKSDGTLNRNLRVVSDFVEANIKIDTGRLTKTVGVVPNLVGQPKAGFWISSIELDPPTITLIGSDKTLAEIESVLTAPINIDGLEGNLQEATVLKLPRLTQQLGDNLVKVNIRLATSELLRTVPVTPNFANLNSRLEVLSFSPQIVNLVLSGTPEILNRVTSRDIRLNVNLDGLISGKNRVQLTPEMVQLPNGLKVENFEPEGVEIELRKI